MLRDNLVGLIEPMRSARELNPRALFTEQKKSSDDRPQDALKIPAPEGRNLTLTENAASPFHAEPRQAVERGEVGNRMREQLALQNQFPYRRTELHRFGTHGGRASF